MRLCTTRHYVVFLFTFSSRNILIFFLIPCLTQSSFKNEYFIPYSFYTSWIFSAYFKFYYTIERMHGCVLLSKMCIFLELGGTTCRHWLGPFHVRYHLILRVFSLFFSPDYQHNWESRALIFPNVTELLLRYVLSSICMFLMKLGVLRTSERYMVPYTNQLLSLCLEMAVKKFGHSPLFQRGFSRFLYKWSFKITL